MNKFLVYTSNLPFMPKDMEEVINFAKENNKFRIANVELNPVLANVKEGDNIFTKKGNSLYVIRTFTKSLEDLSAEESKYLDDLTRMFGLKKVGITGVDSVVKFESWCRYAKPIINKTTNSFTNSKNNSTMEKSTNSIKGIAARMKEMFMPTEAKDVRIATDGNICVATSQGYVSIDANNQLTSYPVELTIDLPVFVICKPKNQLTVGDVIALDRSYAKVVKIDGDKISAISYTGAGKTVHTIKDFLFNQTMVRVVVSLAGNLGGQINPMMLMMMSGKDDKDSLLPLMMMTQNGGAVGMNPMMLMLLADKGEGSSSMKDMLMLSAISGNNMFGNMFGQPVQPSPAQPVDLRNMTELKGTDFVNPNEGSDINEGAKDAE